MSIKGTNVFITGASRGLGAAIGQSLSDGGATVFAASRSTLGLDVRDPLFVAAWVDDIRADVLFCNAGIYGPIGPLETNSLDEWKACLETNLMGVVNCCWAFIPQMKQRKKGKIIIVAGGGATRPRPNFSAYATSKAAVVRFMECIAEELKPWNVDVNCMAPGALNTSIHDAVISAGPSVVGEDEYHNALVARYVPADFTKACDLALWLASPESDGVTGQLIHAHSNYRNLKLC